ncbi:hypothetical protein EW145_g1629 [Phellinidium pouzarii]|uniref:F-box domain-containing protein n=1 Tax=Phellinidium pouzarii TaxID=167371 RepID=A0A4S4LFP6_9AGAM|nr:hypothetical protein EW145_g1629 [Phellinidium pouzarii]
MEVCDSSSRSRLVDDLIPTILNHLAADFGQRFVATLALVSSAWLRPARRTLYASPTVSTYHACYLLSRTLSDTPDLRDRIHTLHLHPVSRTCEAGTMCACKSDHTIALGLAPIFRLPNLEAISLSCDCAIHAQRYLRSFTFPGNVREICVEGMQWHWSFQACHPVSASLCWSDTLAFRFPNLKRLKLVNLDLSIYESRAFESKSPYIESLHLERVKIIDGKLSDLARNAWGDLQDIALTVTEYSSQFDLHTILFGVAQSLRTLKYFVKEDNSQYDLSALIGEDALASCSTLRDLYLSMPFTSSILLKLGRRLTRLEVLKVYDNYELSVQDWARVISANAFPNLCELHLPIGHELRRLAEWQWSSQDTKGVRQACAARSIELQFAYLAV